MDFEAMLLAAELREEKMKLQKKISSYIDMQQILWGEANETFFHTTFQSWKNQIKTINEQLQILEEPECRSSR